MYIVPFTWLFTFAIIFGLRLLAKFWQLGQQGAAGSIGGGIQIPETSLQALSSFSLPPPHPQESLLAGYVHVHLKLNLIFYISL